MATNQAEGTNTQVVIATFTGPDTADRAMETIQRLDHEGWIKAADAAVLSRSQDGFVTVRDTHDITLVRDSIAGAIAGGLIGMLGGPVVGAAGAIAGGVGAGAASHHMNFGFTREEFEAIAAQMKPGTSA